MVVEFVTESVYGYLRVKHEDHHIAQMFTPGFAKSWPAAARRPYGPPPAAHDGPLAQWPSPDFPQFFVQRLIHAHAPT